MLASLFLNKWVLGGLAVLAILVGAYEAGHSSGYNDGYTVAWNTQQQAINKQVDADNAERNASAAKLSALETSAAHALQSEFAARAAAQTARSTVIVKYKQANPQVAASCGWSIPTVQTINQILNAGSIPVAASAAGATP
jgi:hypothetical protein